MAGPVGRVEDLVVEDREVERKAKTNRVRGRKLRDSHIRGCLVRVQRLVCRLLALLALGKFGEVAVVVALHLVIEDLALARGSAGNEVHVEDLQNVLADLGQLGLDLVAVVLDHAHLPFVAFALLLLLDGRDDTPACPTRANHVLVCDAQKIALLNRQLLVRAGHFFHVLDHLLVSLCLLGQLGQVDEVLAFAHLRRMGVDGGGIGKACVFLEVFYGKGDEG